MVPEFKSDCYHHCGKRGHTAGVCFKKKDGKLPSRPTWGAKITERWNDNRATTGKISTELMATDVHKPIELKYK